MKLTYIQQSGSPPVGDGGDQYTGLDRFGRVIDQRWIKDSTGADLERVEYGFDRASNRVWRNNTVADALSANQDEFYTYDGLNQLLTLQRGTLNSGKTGITGTPTWEEDFSFDPTGNWNNYVNQVSGTTTLNQPRTHNAVNEVETISGSSALIQQNAAGNMVKAPKPLDWSSAYTMTYDAWQRLVKVKSGSTTTAIYAYDGHNRRTTKVTGSTTRHYYYYSSQWQILEERLNTATTADRQFVWGLMGIDNLILRDRGSERFYSLQDVFSCTAIADATGTIQERYGYNAFGLSRVMTPAFGNRTSSSYDWETRYDNYRFDSESNFYQVRNRYLHPTLGRWLTRDPIGYEDGNNLYRYVGNNPIQLIDVFGLGCCCLKEPLKVHKSFIHDGTQAKVFVVMHAIFDGTKKNCDANCCEFRQEVKGRMVLNGKYEPTLSNGTILSSKTYHDDGYSKKNDPGDYTLESNGDISFLSDDEPGASGYTTYSLWFAFRGYIVDTCKGNKLVGERQLYGFNANGKSPNVKVTIWGYL